MTRMKNLVCAAALATTLGGGFSSAYAKPKSEPPMVCAREIKDLAIPRVSCEMSSQDSKVREAVKASSSEKVIAYIGIQVDMHGVGIVKSVKASKEYTSPVDIKRFVTVSLKGIAFPKGMGCAGTMILVSPGG